MTSDSIHHSCCKIESTQILPMAAYLLNRSCTVAETYGRNTCSKALYSLCKKCFSETVSRIYDLFGNLNYSRTIYWHFKFLFFPCIFSAFPFPLLFFSLLLIFKNIIAGHYGHMASPGRILP